MAPRPDITDEQWMEEVLKSHQSNDPGLTMREWMARWGVSDRTTMLRLRRAVEAGLMVVGRRAMPRVDGIGCMKPVYRVVKRKKG